MKIRTLSIAVALALVPMVAGATTYKCNFSDPGRFKVIPSEVRVSVASDGQSAKVIDGAIRHHFGGPIETRFFKDTTSAMRVRWRLENVINGSGQKGTLDYSLVYRKARDRAFVTFSAHGYSNTDQGTGTCVLE